MLRLSDDLQVGKAGEYLVCFIIFKGCDGFTQRLYA